MDFIKSLTILGGEVYEVGGCIRDKLFNRIHKSNIVSKDYDLLVRNLSIDTIVDALKPYGHTKQVGKAFGIINFHHFSLDTIIEIALPRVEKSIGTKYKDFEIIIDEYASVEMDLSRRDATINSIAHRIYCVDDLLSDEINKSQIIDPFGGIKDVEKKIWKAVNDPHERFIEDPTRILRAVRQCSQFNLDLDYTTRHTICEYYELLKTLKDDSLSRLSTEMIKIIQGKYVTNWIQFVFNSGIANALSLNYDLRDIKHIVDAIIRCNEIDCSYVSKMAAILIPLGESVNDWIIKYHLSSASTFDCKYIDVLIAIVYSVPNLHSVLSERTPKELTRIEMRKMIQSIQKPQY